MKSAPLLSRRELLAIGAAGPLIADVTGGTPFDHFFLTILQGFLNNAARTSDSWAVCDFSGGTKLPGALANSGKTYDSVSRMLPAIAAWIVSGREPQRFNVNGRSVELIDVVVAAFRNGFDPGHPDYWNAFPDRQNQRQVESSIVAWSLWLLADRVLPKLDSRERKNVQNWLSACGRQPVRNNNWAWFTAVNHAARIALSKRWKVFEGDTAFMVDDLKALDSMAAPGEDGWYSDSFKEPAYDYYNFWVFASHFLYWNKILGARYPEWRARFERRLRAFLSKTPYFFGANGSHVLFGRSLIYRWGELTPLLLAYGQGLWPHSPGLLRTIARRNFQYLWDLGGYDHRHGALRERLTPFGTREICESYIDNGHPYWGMQAFALYLIPAGDPFWTAPEEPLPVERKSFAVRFDGTKMHLRGDSNTGEVRWALAFAGHGGPTYRDKYSKFSYSTHFPWCIVPPGKGCALDALLVFRDPKTGAAVGPAGFVSGKLNANGYEREWWSMLNGSRIQVRSVVELRDEFEIHRHEVQAPEGVEILEGSYALGLPDGKTFDSTQFPQGLYARVRDGAAVASIGTKGWTAAAVHTEEGTNIVFPRSVAAVLTAIAGQGVTTLEAFFYASTKPLPPEDLRRRVERLAGEPQ